LYCHRFLVLLHFLSGPGFLATANARCGWGVGASGAAKGEWLVKLLAKCKFAGPFGLTNIARCFFVQWALASGKWVGINCRFSFPAWKLGLHRSQLISLAEQLCLSGGSESSKMGFNFLLRFVHFNIWLCGALQQFAQTDADTRAGFSGRF